MPDKIHLTWANVTAAVDQVLEQVTLRPVLGVYGIPRGGCVPAVLVAQRLGVPVIDFPEAWSELDPSQVLVVDDLADHGTTIAPWLERGHQVVTLYRKPHTSTGVPAIDVGAVCLDGWIVFPWEADTDEDEGPTDAVRRLLQFIGEDPTRPGLLDTPARVVKALAEMTEGYSQDPETILGKRFPDTADEMVVVDRIEFHSLCEHHLLGFAGTVTIAYIPNGEVVGLSKFARLVDVYARRLQVQERLTEQIADAIATHVGAVGVGVVVRARHSCMGSRGVRKPGAEMVTSALRGALRDDPSARAEFLVLAKS